MAISLSSPSEEGDGEKSSVHQPENVAMLPIPSPTPVRSRQNVTGDNKATVLSPLTNVTTLNDTVLNV
ncbi:MFS transporter [Sesbania bispinosa]|nr:MFS transporter [Sesbania bispinosa]